MTSETNVAPRKKGCLRWAVRGPLGCLAFLIGALIVVGFLLPATIGSVLEPAFEQEFAADHSGTLSFGEFRLAWFSPQRIENIMLRDPSGGYVASGELRMPPLGDCFRLLGSGELSPITIDLDANLVVSDDGAFNLARALAPRTGEPPPRQEPHVVKIGSGENDGRMFEGAAFGFELGTCRLACSTPRLRSGLRRDLVLVFDEGQLHLAEAGQHTLSAKGRVEGGGAFEVSCAFDRAEELLAARAAPRTWSLGASDVQSGLLAALLPPGLPCEEALGPRVASLRCKKADPARPRVELELRSDRARIGAAGDLTAAGFASAPDAPSTAQADFTLDGWWRDAVVLRLLPLLSELAPAGEGVAGLALDNLELAAGGDLRSLRADVRLDLPEVSFMLLARRAEGSDPAPGPGAASGGPVRLSPLLLRIQGGIVEYDGVALDLPAGRVVLTGSYHLGLDQLELKVSLPAALARELGLAERETELLLTGPAAAPLVRRSESR